MNERWSEKTREDVIARSPLATVAISLTTNHYPLITFFLLTILLTLCWPKHLFSEVVKSAISNPQSTISYSRALSLYESSQLGSAMEECLNILSIEPQNTKARLLLRTVARALIRSSQSAMMMYANAQAFYESGQLSFAMEECLNILSMEPQNTEARLLLRKAARELSLEQEGLRHTTEQVRKQWVEEAWQSLGYITPAEAELQLSKALGHAEQEEWLWAWTLLSQLLERKPPESIANNVGKHLSQLEDKLNGWSREDDKLQRLYAKGFLSYREAKFDEAVQIWQNYSKIYPGSPEIQDFIQKAEELFQTQAQRQHIQELIKKAEEHVNAGNFPDALALFENVLQIDPGHVKAKNEVKWLKNKIESNKLTALAQTRFEKGRFFDATHNCLKALRLDPENKLAEILWDKIQKTLLQTSRAAHPSLEKESGLKRITEKDRESAARHYNQGLIYYTQGELEKALKEWKIALRKDPTHTWSQEATRRVRAELNLK